MTFSILANCTHPHLTTFKFNFGDGSGHCGLGDDSDDGGVCGIVENCRLGVEHTSHEPDKQDHPEDFSVHMMPRM